MSFLNAMLNVILPKICVNCGSFGSYCCDECLKNIAVKHEKRSHLAEKRIVHIVSCVEFQDKTVKELVHAFKYGGIEELGVYIAHVMREGVKSFQYTFQDSDIIIPVPLHKRKYFERGYNQSEVLAHQCFKKEMVKSEILIRKHRTESQTGLTKEQRTKNTADAFEVVNRNDVLQKRVVLIDDVVTSGATICACAKVLYNKGAKEVIGLVFARD